MKGSRMVDGALPVKRGVRTDIGLWLEIKYMYTAIDEYDFHSSLLL